MSKQQHANNEPWSRAIILVDMNAFFASIEQLDFPALRGKPIAVTNGEQGTCIITSSYEARAYGVKTGMRLPEARQLCPQLIQRTSRPRRYIAVSRTIMAALHDITPDVEVFSVDEAFLDVTHCQRLHGTPMHIGRMVQKKICEVSQVSCSIGVSGDKTTAKYAAKLKKPNGFSMIPPWEAKHQLCHVPVTALCGIAKGIGDFLAQHGVYTCGEMEKIPISVLAQRFGNVGRRIWYMCQGCDPSPVTTQVMPPKSMGHGKVIPPNTTDSTVIMTYILHMCEKLASRLRRHHMQAQQFFIGLRNRQFGWIGGKSKTLIATNDGAVIFRLAQQLLAQHWQQEPVWQVQVTALDPRLFGKQGDLFIAVDEERVAVNLAIDEINARYGELIISPARLLNRSKMQNVIAPAWRPDGHRQTIE